MGCQKYCRHWLFGKWKFRHSGLGIRHDDSRVSGMFGVRIALNYRGLISHSAAMLMLRAKPPESWLPFVLENLPAVLVDHAHLERKAASSALNLEKYRLLSEKVEELNAIAIEELQHFQMVMDLLKAKCQDREVLLEVRTGVAILRQMSADNPVDRPMLPRLRPEPCFSRGDRVRVYLGDSADALRGPWVDAEIVTTTRVQGFQRSELRNAPWRIAALCRDQVLPGAWDLVFEPREPRVLTVAEHAALTRLCRRDPAFTAMWTQNARGLAEPVWARMLGIAIEGQVSLQTWLGG